MPKEISVLELKEKLNDKNSFRFIDCREQDEFDYAKIEGAELIPLSEFEGRFATDLKIDEEIVICCHHGSRSMHACLFLESQGYENTVNVMGGMDQWSLQVDSKVKRY